MEFIAAKTMVTKTKNQHWFGTDYNMNIYRGCNHGCIYCDSRSDCYQIEDFDRVRAKKDSIELLERELSGKRSTGVIGTGAMSDPYNSFEKEYQLTRKALEVINRHEFGVAIATKGSLIARDADLLTKIARHSPVLCKITVTAADDELSRCVEPGAPPSSERIKALKELTDSGIYAGVLLMPVLPFIEDSPKNILGIVEMAADAGAKFVYPGFGVTLRQSQRDYYFKALDQRFPGMSQQYRRLYGDAYSNPAQNAKNLYAAFAKACESRGIQYKMSRIIADYKQGYGSRQLTLF